jgi:single-stranded DNA-binding protein
MMSINTLYISGRLTAEPERKTLGNGSELLKLVIIHNVWNGKDKEDTKLAFEVNVWKGEKRGAYEDILDQSFVKGQEIVLSGRLNSRTYDGKTYLQLDYPVLHGSKAYKPRVDAPEPAEQRSDDVPF